MKLYYSKGTCSFAIRILINEIGIDCHYEAVDFATKKTAAGEDYLKINPKGTVPALLNEDNQLITENAAIQQYLADRFSAVQLLPEVNNINRYRVLEWLNYIATDLHKSFSPLFNRDVEPAVKQKTFLPILQKKLVYLDESLKNKNSLIDHFSLPDTYLFTILNWLPHFNLDISLWPNLAAYYNNLKLRPSIQKSLQEEA